MRIYKASIAAFLWTIAIALLVFFLYNTNRAWSEPVYDDETGQVVEISDSEVAIMEANNDGELEPPEPVVVATPIGEVVHSETPRISNPVGSSSVGSPRPTHHHHSHHHRRRHHRR